MYFELQFF